MSASQQAVQPLSHRCTCGATDTVCLACSSNLLRSWWGASEWALFDSVGLATLSLFVQLCQKQAPGAAPVRYIVVMPAAAPRGRSASSGVARPRVASASAVTLPAVATSPTSSSAHTLPTASAVPVEPLPADAVPVVNLTALWPLLSKDLFAMLHGTLTLTEERKREATKLYDLLTQVMALKHKEEADPTITTSAAAIADGFLLLGASMFQSIAHYYTRPGELFPGQFVLANACKQCKAEFGSFTRRHSCRMCGCSTCSDCRQVGVTLYYQNALYFGTSVCNACFTSTHVLLKPAAATAM
eukprot:TRINITY_DN8113_c0_g2_i1.p1 TRINITY_DN8113_c0_g2~~TRINITY_DN8113_c0_g2_i1.p1  ORF type:complete len:300 (-),score=77.70 TRINITY_DN8113_c0_g2_i1:49-948(-)